MFACVDNSVYLCSRDYRLRRWTGGTVIDEQFVGYVN